MKNKFIVASLLVWGCMMSSAQDNDTPVYLDDRQPLELRIEDALKRMTLE